MKLWRAQGDVQHIGTRILWASSKDNIRRLVKNSYPGAVFEVEQREVPTTRDKLITFLNTYAYRE